MRPVTRLRTAILVFCALLFLYALGSHGLLEDNEARFFEISWEMERSGNWLVPHLNFIPHFHKPPGTFWLVGASLRLFGESEAAGRLPVALSALFCLGLLYRWALQEGDETLAARAVLILATSLQFWFMARMVLTDMFLAVSVTIAMYFAWRSRQTGRSTDAFGFWTAVAASTLFKGPVGLVVVFPVLGLTKWLDPEKKSWNLRSQVGLPWFLLLSLPWYLAVCYQFDGLWQYFLGFQTAQRMLTTVHGRPGAWWFYAPALLAGLFPWSASLVLGVTKAIRSREVFDRFLLLWIAFPLLFFSLAGSKLPTYLLPIYPALALLLARAGRDATTLKKMALYTAASLAAFGSAIGLYLSAGAAPALIPAAKDLELVAALCLSSSIALWWRRHSTTPGGTFLVVTLTFASCLMLLTSAVGRCDQAFSARRLASELAEWSSKTAIVEVSDHLHGLPYYLHRRLIQVDYPRETQFSKLTDYQDFLFRSLEEYRSNAAPSPSPIYILRSSDYASERYPGYRAKKRGPWTVLFPLPPTETYLRPEPPDRGRTLRRGADLQRT